MFVDAGKMSGLFGKPNNKWTVYDFFLKNNSLKAARAGPVIVFTQNLSHDIIG